MRSLSDSELEAVSGGVNENWDKLIGYPQGADQYGKWIALQSFLNGFTPCQDGIMGGAVAGAATGWGVLLGAAGGGIAAGCWNSGPAGISMSGGEVMEFGRLVIKDDGNQCLIGS